MGGRKEGREEMVGGIGWGGTGRGLASMSRVMSQEIIPSFFPRE